MPPVFPRRINGAADVPVPAVVTAVKDGREVCRVESSVADRLEAVQENCARCSRTFVRFKGEFVGDV